MLRPTLIVLFTVLTTAGLTATTEDAQGSLIGYTQPALIALLGEPMGSLSFDEETILIYPTQRITLVEGKVAKVENRPDALLETPEERDERIAAKRAEIGEKLLEKQKYDPSILKKTPEEQLRHWGRFKMQYPETDVNPELEKARLRLEEDLEQDHVIVKTRQAPIRPHESVTDPFYRKRVDFHSPFDSHNRVVVVIPSGNRRYPRHRPIEQEPYLIEPLPDHLPHDEIFNTPKAVAPILIPPDQEQGALRLEDVGSRSDTIDARSLKRKTKTPRGHEARHNAN